MTHKFLRLLLSALLVLGGATMADAVPAYVGGASAHATTTSPTLSYTATSGNLLFALITINDALGTTTCTAPTGWTKIHADEPIYTNYVLCAATKIATGSDVYTWTISASMSWALGVVEFSDIGSATATTFGLADRNTSAPAVTSAGASASGTLVIAGLVDTYEAALVGPSGYTALVLTPASTLHYGGNFVAMGALAWKISAGATETATWGQSDSHFTGLGIYTFSAGGGGGGGTGRLLTLGVGAL